MRKKDRSDIKPMTGRIIGDLTVLGRDGTYNGSATWWCHCVCGKMSSFTGTDLRGGKRKSCGCHWQTTFEKTKICLRCKLEKPHEDFHKSRDGKVVRIFCKPCNREVGRARYHQDKEAYKARSNKTARNARIKVLAAYGNKCACCGEKEEAFLAIDHIDNNGGKHRRETGLNGSRLYLWLEKQGWPAGYQILCCNCNWGKHVNGGICPHQKKGI